MVELEDSIISDELSIIVELEDSITGGRGGKTSSLD